MNKIKRNILPIYIIINILYVLIGGFLVVTNLVNSKYISYGNIFVLLPLNIIMAIIFRKKFKKDVMYIPLLAIFFFGIISTIFAFKPNVALFGEAKRYEGLFMIAYYLSLVVLSSLLDKKDKKKIVIAIIVVGIIEVIFGLIQKFSLFGFPQYIHKGKIFFNGLTTNPNFLGSLILISLCYSIGLFFDSKHKILYFIISLFLLSGLYLTNTLSSLVGFIFVLLYIIVYSIKNKQLKKMFVILLSSASLLLVFHFTNQTTLVNDLNSFKRETSQMITGSYKSDYDFGTGRVDIWKRTLKYVPQNMMTGVGLDNFKYIKNGRPFYRYGVSYDKVHNEYLQFLITGGIFYLLSYLTLYGIIVLRGVKYSFKNKELYLIIPVIGYLVQAFFNISVIEVAPFFYIVLGLNSKR